MYLMPQNGTLKMAKVNVPLCVFYPNKNKCERKGLGSKGGCWPLSPRGTVGGELGHSSG